MQFLIQWAVNMQTQRSDPWHKMQGMLSLGLQLVARSLRPRSPISPSGGKYDAYLFTNNVCLSHRLLMKGQSIVGSMGSSRGDSAVEMFEMVKRGQLKPGLGSKTQPTYSLETFIRAFETLSTRKAIGKIIVKIRPGGSRL